MKDRIDMVHILVDSGSDIRPGEYEGVEVIDLKLSFGENLTIDEYYEALKKGEALPKTSQPPAGEFAEIYEKLLGAGDELVVLTISSALSGTCQSAGLAKDLSGKETVWIFDTLNATHGMHMLVEEAVRLRGQGKNAAEIMEGLEALRGRIRIFFVPETLEWLYRGGRLSRGAAFLGNLANLKPILTVTGEGTVGVVDKCLGMRRSLASIIKKVADLRPDPDYPTWSLYTHGTDLCEELEIKMEKAGLHVDDRMRVGTVIGTHIGPGATGIAFVAEKS